MNNQRLAHYQKSVLRAQPYLQVVGRFAGFGGVGARFDPTSTSIASAAGVERRRARMVNAVSMIILDIETIPSVMCLFPDALDSGDDRAA